VSADLVRVALVGAGRMGRTHLEALEHADGLGIAGVVEPVASLRESLSKRGYRTFPDASALLHAGGVDAVLIAAPSDLHLELVRRFAAAGLPILCEKPVGVGAEEAIEAAAAVERAGVLMQVGYWRRFVPELCALRARIAAGELGEIYQVSCLQWDAAPPSDGFRAHSGGIAVDMAVHEFDQTRWLTGQEVAWLTATRGAGGEAAGRDPDVAVILAQLSGGAAATVSLGRTFPHGDCCWIEVFGSAGYERLEFIWGEPGDAVFRAALVAQVEAFAAAVRGAAPVGAGANDAIAALTAAELAGDALLDGHPRELPAAAVRTP
jgi:myo-inositol 2-dehydrogenase / D-chiro-inositol 1-dehydrogenase